MDLEVIRALEKELEEGRDVALVIITESKGSTPGADNSSMAVLQNKKTIGTVGGGAIEYDLTKEAIKALEKNEEKSLDYSLTEKEELKMLCGGQNKAYIKIFRANPKLVIFGAGHVGQKLARIAAKTNFDVEVVDKREDYKDKKDFENIGKFVVGPKDFLKDKDFDQNTYIIICTPDYDEKVLEKVLDKTYKYLGMIGSKRKVKRVFDSLEDKGFDKDLLKKVHAPVGFDIGDGSVEEIAISIMAQILAVKNGKEE